MTLKIIILDSAQLLFPLHWLGSVSDTQQKIGLGWWDQERFPHCLGGDSWKAGLNSSLPFSM